MVNYQVLLAIFQLNVNLLVSDRNTIACAQCCVRNLVLHILYVGYRFILACINVSYICIVSCYAGQILQFFVQRYLYIGTIVGYLDVLITRSVFCTAEVNLCTRCYIGCCTAVSRNVPACICYVAYFLQLSVVYCIGLFCAVCYILDSAILVKGSFVNGNSRACKVDCTACTFDRLHASQIFTDRNCICVTNFDTIAFGIGGIGICNSSFCAINSNGCSFLVCSLYNIYHRARFDSISLTIDCNACCSTIINNSLYLRTGSKCLLSCTIRNLNKSIIICTTAASTATAGNGNSTINSLTAISYQADNCRIGIFSQSNFFNNVFIQILDILIYHSQITVILANRIGFHSSTGICNASCPITIELTIILYCHKNFIILAINSAGINLAAVSIGKHAQIAVNNIHVSIIYSFSFISIGLLSRIPFQSRTYSFKAFRHLVAN